MFTALAALLRLGWRSVAAVITQVAALARERPRPGRFYRNPELCAIVEDHRACERDAHTVTSRHLHHERSRSAG